MLLRDRRVNGAIMAGACVVGAAGLLAVFLTIGCVWAWPLALMVGLAAKGSRIVFAVNRRMRELPPPLPKATLRLPRDPK